MQKLAAVSTAEETGVPGLSLHTDFVSEAEEQVRLLPPAMHMRL